ncbi:MAG: hypothetical protein RLZZ22_1927 [Pseudomonadota bacterium]|jgi:hypothetical protein
MRRQWPLLLVALWWGGLSALSFVAVPLAFAHFGSPALAGPYAARLFQIQSWASLGAAPCLLLWARAQAWRAPVSPGTGLLASLWPWLLIAALAALAQEFGVAQRIVSARARGADLRLWHGAGTALVLLQWVCALRVLIRLAGGALEAGLSRARLVCGAIDKIVPHRKRPPARKSWRPCQWLAPPGLSGSRRSRRACHPCRCRASARRF